MSAGGNWGATADERAAPLACDDLLPAAEHRWDRALSVRAPPALVFSWLCQLRVAPYSYDLIDNLGRHSPRERDRALTRLEVGQPFMTIFRLRSFATDDHLTVGNRRMVVTYAVRPAPTAAQTRLAARVLFAPPGGRLGNAAIGLPLALGDLVMMRRQLLTLKALSERDAQRG